MNKISIKSKLYLVATLAGVGMLFMALNQYWTLNHVQALQDIRVLVSDIESSMLMLRRNEKDFLARKDLKYREKFTANYEKLQSKSTALITTLESKGLDSSIASSMGDMFVGYNEIFMALVAQYQVIGLNPKDGLYGSLRNAVHNAESSIKDENNYKLMTDMLMLRRREKDFMLRYDLKYLAKFEKDFASMTQHINEAEIDANTKQKISGFMEKYENDFQALVAATKKVGLNSKQGLRGEMRAQVHETETMFGKLSEGAVQEIGNQNIQSAIVALAMIVLISGFVVFIARQILMPIKSLSTIMSRASAEQDLTLRASIEGKDEISLMANNFNHMMQEFEGLLREILSSSTQLSSAAEELTMITKETDEQMKRQNLETDQVATAITEMTSTVQEVARHANEAASTSQSANDSTNEGMEVVGQNKQHITALAEEVSNAASVINELSVDSEKIGTVLTVIREIAEQTNLLALNAAIEAARAGEQGRGFAVVADEVRTLAQRSQSSTAEIEQIVERLQTSASKAVGVMDSGKERADGSVSRAESVGSSLSEITHAISAINDMNFQIASAAEEQASVSQEIDKNVVNISNIAKETFMNAEQTTQTANSLSSLAHSLNSMVSRFKVG